ncbi:MAG: T9SS type A sorting domain-containing protein, partial [Saprospiraceae bacterium]
PCADCTVTWSDGQTGPEITVFSEGNYTATASNVCGESPASESVTVTEIALPETLTLTTDGTTALCPGASVVLTAENPCADCTVTWSDGQTGPEITVFSEGNYTATASNVCGESPASLPVAVTIEPPFLPEVLLTNLCQLAAPVGSDYQWYLNGMAIPGATGQFWSAQTTGSYSVTMLSPAGCLGTSGLVLAEACASSTTVLVGSLAVRVYPNPASDRVLLELLSPADLTDVRFDLYTADGRYMGRLLQRDALSGGASVAIRLPGLPSGAYVYRLLSKQGSVTGGLAVIR